MLHEKILKAYDGSLIWLSRKIGRWLRKEKGSIHATIDSCLCRGKLVSSMELPWISIQRSLGLL